MNPVTVAELAAALIAVFEGCRLMAYQDSGGVWTIGIGHTGADVTPGMVITQAEAQALFEKDQAPLLAKVGSGKGVADAAALVSFGFNCGIGALERVMAGQATLDQFVKDHKGDVLPGLVARRRLEETLMLLGQQVST
jgi:lysozyme